jgi:hypothetical protein
MLTDSEISSICSQEIHQASNTTSELKSERADALDYYLGELYGDEQEGRSQVVTTEVRDTIQSILPSLMRIFRDADNLFTFDPVSEEDEDAAKQESDRVTYAYFKQNPSFLNTLSFCTDALLSKTGVLKVWWDENPTDERAEYKNLDENDLAELLGDEAVEREIVEYEQHEGGYDITFNEKRINGKVKVESVPPEDFGVNADARTPNAQDCDFVWHRMKKTKAQLIADGLTKDQIAKLPKDDDTLDSEERIARNNLTDQDGSRSDEMRPYWVTECYLRLDVREDGKPAMWQVLLASGADGGPASLLNKEEVDSHPFFTCTPVLMTHRFHGLSIADLVGDLQRIKSTILRNILDNQYLANNRRHAISNRTSLDDMLTNRPGGVVRVDSEVGDIMGDIVPIQSTPLAAETFGLMQSVDDMIKDRTGAGEDVGGLDAKSLANVNSSVAALAYDQSRMKIVMIAELIAEIGFRPAFKRIHELLQKKQDKKEVMKLRNKWVEVNPSEWRTRENMTIMIGMGVSSRERRLVALDTIAQRQQVIVQGGGLGTLVSQENLFNSVIDHADAMGIEGSRYFMDPAEAEPPQDEGPNLQEQAMMLTAQAQMGAAKAQNDRNQIEMAKVQSAEKIRIAELQASQQDLMLRRQIEGMKADRDAMKSEMDTAQSGSKAMLDAEIKARDQEIKMAEVRLKDGQEQAKRETEMYRALLASSTTLTKEQMQIANSASPGTEVSAIEDKFTVMMQDALGAVVQSMSGEFGEIKARLMEQSESSKAPKLVKRDKNGLIVAIGDKPVTRDASGRVEAIG